MTMSAQNGLIHLASQHSVEETMQRLEGLLKERGSHHLRARGP